MLSFISNAIGLLPWNTHTEKNAQLEGRATCRVLKLSRSKNSLPEGAGHSNADFPLLHICTLSQIGGK